MKKTLAEKYCRKKHIPYNEEIENTFGFCAYRVNYFGYRLRAALIKDTQKQVNNIVKVLKGESK